LQKRKAYDKLLQLYKNIEDRKTIDRKKYVEQAPLIFLVIGILLCLVILFLINRFRRFREYLFRSIFRPYNFYADIRDQRILSTFQSYILGSVISINLALYFSSILYFYRTNELSQFILMLLFPTALQEFLYRLIWSPELFLLLMSVLFYLLVFLIAFIVKLFSLLVKSRIYYSDTFTITIWSGAPFIALIPISIVLLRLMIAIPIISWIAIILLGIIIIWVIFRILRSVSIVFDIPFIKSILFGLGFIIIIVTIVITLYQSNTEIIAYLSYFKNVFFN
jgi:beta-galactosidase